MPDFLYFYTYSIYNFMLSWKIVLLPRGLSSFALQGLLNPLYSFWQTSFFMYRGPWQHNLETRRRAFEMRCSSRILSVWYKDYATNWDCTSLSIWDCTCLSIWDCTSLSIWDCTSFSNQDCTSLSIWSARLSRFELARLFDLRLHVSHD